MILSGDEIEIDNLPSKIQATADSHLAPAGRLTLDDMERQYVLDALSEESDDKVATAKTLGIDLSTLYRKLKRYELD